MAWSEGAMQRGLFSLRKIAHYFLNGDKQEPLTLIRRRSDMHSLGNHQYRAIEVWLAYNDKGVGYGREEMVFIDHSETNPEISAWQGAIQTRNAALAALTYTAQNNAIQSLITLYGDPYT